MVDFKDKTKLKIAITKDRKDIVKLYRRIFGKALHLFVKSEVTKKRLRSGGIAKLNLI